MHRTKKADTNVCRVSQKWQEKYPNAMRRWEENWDVLSPMFKFSAEVRKSHVYNKCNRKPLIVYYVD